MHPRIYLHIRVQSSQCRVVPYSSGLAPAIFSRSIVLHMYVFYPERPPETDILLQEIKIAS
jgi:hypothetical protein